METVEGYEMSSWARGYGDFVMKPDMDTLRPIPWHEGTALLMADIHWHDGSDVVASPRQILRKQLARLAERGWRAFAGHRAGVHRLQRHLRGGLEEGLPRPRADQPLQRRLLAAGHRAGRAADPADPQLDDGRGDEGRELEGRVQLRPARDQLPLRRGAGRLRRPRDLQERRQGDRLAGGLRDHLHGEVQRARGQLVPHPLLARGRGRHQRLRRGRGAVQQVPRRAARLPARR